MGQSCGGLDTAPRNRNNIPDFPRKISVIVSLKDGKISRSTFWRKIDVPFPSEIGRSRKTKLKHTIHYYS